MQDKQIVNEIFKSAFTLANSLQEQGLLITAKVSVEGNYDGAPVMVVMESRTRRAGMVVNMNQLVYREESVRYQMITHMIRDLAMKLIRDITTEAFSVQATTSTSPV